MPTLARIGPYRFYHYSHEPNEPAHVHIDRDEATMKVWLEPVALARSQGFKRPEIGTVVVLVTENKDTFVKAWNEYFS